MSDASPTNAEVAIVGGGIAGASLAYFLAERGVNDVVLLEREPAPACHASGRSARTLLEFDLHPIVQRLKIAGGRFLRRPPDGFCDEPLLRRNGAMRLLDDEAWSEAIARESQLRDEGLEFDLLDVNAACAQVGVLDPSGFAGAVHLPEGGFIDVPRLISAFLRGAERAGHELRTGAAVRAVEEIRGSELTSVVTDRGEVRARVVVNAAGAWSTELGRMAGASPIELVAMRRSIATFSMPQHLDAGEVGSWPLVWSDPQSVSFRPGFDGLMVCAMDEVPTAPCDAACVDGVFEAASERLARLAPRFLPAGIPPTARRWAGLRTFSSDGAPVVGFDPLRAGFFWLAGQAGCGIETSAVLGRVAADLIAVGTTEAFDPAALSPRRFA